MTVKAFVRPDELIFSFSFSLTGFLKFPSAYWFSYSSCSTKRIPSALLFIYNKRKKRVHAFLKAMNMIVRYSQLCPAVEFSSSSMREVLCLRCIYHIHTHTHTFSPSQIVYLSHTFECRISPFSFLKAFNMLIWVEPYTKANAKLFCTIIFLVRLTDA